MSPKPISTKYFPEQSFKEYGVALLDVVAGEYTIEERDHRREVMERAIVRWEERHPDAAPNSATLVERTITHTAFRHVPPRVDEGGE